MKVDPFLGMESFFGKMSVNGNMRIGFRRYLCLEIVGILLSQAAGIEHRPFTEPQLI